MMGTQRKRCLPAVLCFLTVSLASAIAQIDPDAGDEVTGARILSSTLDSGAGDNATASAQRGVVAGSLDPECDIIGFFGDPPIAGTTRYRGNAYRFEFAAKLKEIKMELAFSGTTDLHVSIHRKEPNGEYKRYPGGSTDIVIGGADGGTGVPKFFTTGTLDPPVDLEAGFDYAVAFAWGSKTITYSRDEQGYPVPFRAGEVLGLVAVNNLPPPPDPLVPETFPEFIIFTNGAYSMQLCFDPVPGACCSTVSGDCREVLKTDCVGAGSFFHGEYTRCDDTPCIFGTCCDPCDGCHAPYTPEACDLGRPDRNWTAFDCPLSDPELLCPIVTGACCRGTTCTQECRHNCENPPSPTSPGNYRGDGTDCTPNECPGATGACCVSGGCLNRTLSSCTSSNGSYKGPGTTCRTLPSESECGGACCRGFDINNLEFCQHVASRAECAVDPEGFPYSAYRGDGTICPNLTPDLNDNCNDRTEVACCLPDGSCINTTSGFCQADWVKGEPHAGAVCEDQPALCPSLISCCFPDGRCDPMTPNGCTAFGGSAGAGTTCAVDACAPFIPTGACCGNTVGTCAVKTESQCNAQGGLYQGNATNCNAPTAACPGFGACCFNNGDCLEDVSSAQCVSLGGEYQSDASACDAPPVDCDERGACCAITGTCLFITESQCTGIGGDFKGVGAACTGNTCPAGGCCLNDGCEFRTAAGCTAADAAYQGDGVLCQPDLCVFGACCNGAFCSRETRMACERDLGEYIGDNTTCNGPNPCPCTDNAQCDDGDRCTDDSCDLLTGCVNSPVNCDDGDTCTLNSCDPVTGCVYPPNTCDDGDACTDDACVPASGCMNSPINCDDGNECTTIDRCENGTCVNGRNNGLTEFRVFADCLAGPDQPIPSSPPGCVCFDLNADQHVNLLDVAQFFLAFESP